MPDTNPPLREKKAPWRETPLEHWSRDVDPAVMSGDQWVDNERDPGSERMENQHILSGQPMSPLAPFMHPTHDVTYGDE
jgi:hypothetical protein